MTTRKQIIDAARSCLGTPFKHQGRVRGLGLDCVGLIRYPIIATHMQSYEENADFTQYGKDPVPSKMGTHLSKYFTEVRVNELLPGDIIWCRVRNSPQHLAIYTDEDTVIHSVSNGPNRVVEHILENKWRKRIYKIFRYKGVED